MLRIVVAMTISFALTILGAGIMRANVVGGRAVNINAVPYIVSLRVGFPSQGTALCGGSIISKRLVATAAHCVISKKTGADALSIDVRAGSSYFNYSGTKYTGIFFIRNNYYNSTTLNNDIALLQIAPDFVFSQTIQPIQLPDQGTRPVDNALGQLSGWGKTSRRKEARWAGQLQTVTVPIVNQATCRGIFGVKTVTDQMLCAGYTSGTIDSCRGDSGGPLVIGNRLIGLVSWGNGCAKAGYVGVYTNIGTFSDWIKNFNKTLFY